MHGGMSPVAPKGNKNAFKHGRYTAEAIARRRWVLALVRAGKALARDFDDQANSQHLLLHGVDPVVSRSPLPPSSLAAKDT
jgi:hypothetical protein